MAPSPESSPSHPERPLGREPELALLLRALDDALAGRGSVALLTGEAGIGKTRLAETLSREAEARGARVLWGRIWEVEGAPAGWPWTQVLRAGLDAPRPGGADASRAAPLDPTLLAALGPLLSPPAAPRGPAADPLAPTDLFRAASALVRWLEQRTQAAPLLLVFDDLHATDLATSTLLELVARELRRLRVLVLGTAREADTRRSAALSASLARIARHGQTLPLARLDATSTTRLVQRTWADYALTPGPDAAQGPTEQARQALTARVVAASEGNPFFAEALARLAASRGAAGTALPDTIRETLEAALALLQPRTRRTLEAAAVLGREGTVALLERVADTSADEVRSALAEAERAGVLEPSPSPAQWRFSHALMRDAAEAGIEAPRRRALHLRCAELLAERPAASPRGGSAERAHHLLAGGAWQRAVDACARAGAEALEMPDLEAAASWFERGLTALGHAGEEDAAVKAELVLELGSARMRLGRVSEGKPDCLEAVALARALGAPLLLARAALALGGQFTPGRSDGELVAVLEEALAALSSTAPARQDLRARVMARLGAALMPTPAPERPLGLAREAIALARSAGDGRLLAQVMSTARAALTPAESLDERRALDEELAALALRLGDPELGLKARCRLALDFLEQGDGAGLERELVEAERLAQSLRLPVYRWRPVALRLCQASSRLDDATYARREAELGTLSEQLLEAQGEETTTFNRALRARALGRADEERAQLQRLVQRTRNPLFRTVIGSVLLAVEAGRRGDASLARAVLAQLPRGGDPGARGGQLGPPLGLGPAALALVGECALYAGSLELAEEIYRQLAPFEGTVAVMTSLPVAWGPLAATRAQLAAALGDDAEAQRLFAVGERLCLQLGADAWLARVQEARDAWAVARASRSPSSAAGEPVTRPREVAAPPSPRLRVERRGELWTLSLGTQSVQLKDGKGLHYLEALVREPGRELHVADLVGLAEAPSDSAGAAARRLGDAGELLDATARAAYQARLRELDEELREAEAFGDPERGTKARAEREALAEELARAVGLGGRDRKAASGVERARINVQRRLRDLIERVRADSPELARHLEAFLRTGTYCSYRG